MIRLDRLIHPVLVRTGWISLFIGLLVPFGISANALVELRDVRCTSDLMWTVVPLLFTCGPRGPGDLFVGWLATVVTVGSLVVATVCSGVAALRAVMLPARSRGSARRSGIFLASVSLAVAVAVTAVVLSGPDAVWGTNAWVLFASGAGLLVYGVALIVRLALIPWMRDPRPPVIGGGAAPHR